MFPKKIINNITEFYDHYNFEKLDSETKGIV